MIHRTIPTWQLNSWQEELSQLITDPGQLLQRLELPERLLPAALKSAELFPLRVTKSYLNKMRKGDVSDPLLRQVLPIGEEQILSKGFSADPLQESSATPNKGLIHKYKNRVLVIAATQCAINCRYCFRRHFPYQDNKVSRQDWQSVLDYVANDEDIDEVILSGGDPLSLGDKQLQQIVESLARIKHVRRLRVHTRYPVILPSRITPSLIRALTSTRLKAIMVIHANHANELDSGSEMALLRSAEAGVLLLNQSVLLRGVNDHPQTLHDLSLRLFDCGVLPYYLHVLDKVQGAAHFLIDDDAAVEIYNAFKASVSGYLLPKLVREEPRKDSKSFVPVW